MKAKFELTVPSARDRVAGKVAVGATLLTVSENVVWVLVVPSLAVMVTVWLYAGPSLVANDHDHVPDALVPNLIIVPTDALSETVSPASASDQVPVFAAV